MNAAVSARRIPERGAADLARKAARDPYYE
jgi:hypothetical protein